MVEVWEVPRLGDIREVFSEEVREYRESISSSYTP
jgi:hypothetical protein